jgi:hypothetical protein
MEPEFVYGEYTVYTSDVAGEVHFRGKVIKRFKGESAWVNADRWAYDKYTADQHNKGSY